MPNTPKGATPSSAERFTDNPVGKVTKATPEMRAQAARDLAEYEANEAAAIAAAKKSS